MSREDPQLKIRLPEGLKQSIEDAATEGGRSINAEVVERLKASFAPGATVSSAEVDAFQQSAAAYGQTLRLLGYSLNQLSTKHESDSPDVAAFRASLRNLSIILGNGDLPGAVVEASSIVYQMQADRHADQPGGIPVEDLPILNVRQKLGKRATKP